jgi:hypothetical protein
MTNQSLFMKFERRLATKIRTATKHYSAAATVHTGNSTRHIRNIFWSFLKSKMQEILYIIFPILIVQCSTTLSTASPYLET